MLKPSEPTPGASDPGDERPVGEIVHRLVEDGKAYAKSEFNLVKAIASDKGRALALPAVLLLAAFVLLQGGINAFAVSVFVVIAPLIGPLGAGIVAFLIFAAVAGGLGWWAVQKIRRDL